MRRLLVLCVLLVIGVVIVGYYRDWFAFRAASDDKKVNIQLTVDPEKVKEDEERAKEKIKEETERLSEKVKKATSGKKSDEPVP